MSEQVEKWMLVYKGHVVHVDCVREGRSAKALPLADSHENALRFARHQGLPPEVSPALVGSANGETLKGIITGAVETGCTVITYPAGWNEDGSPVLAFIDI